MACDTNGNLYAGGFFTNARKVSANCIAKWDGSAWSALGSGVDAEFASAVNTVAFDTMGNFYAGGMFLMAGTNMSANLAKARLTGPTPHQLLLTNSPGETRFLTYLGTPGTNYALDRTTSLTPPVNWMPQGTNTASTANAATAGYLMFTNFNQEK